MIIPRNSVTNLPSIFRYNELFYTNGRNVTLLEWVKITMDECMYWEEQLDDVRKARRKQAKRKGSVIPEIPEEYIKFKKQLARKLEKAAQGK